MRRALACALALLAVGCSRAGSAEGPDSTVTPIITEECSEAMTALAELEAQYQREFSRPFDSVQWWAARMGREAGPHPATVIAEQYAFVILEAPDCFTIEERAAARQFVNDQ